MTETKRGPGRPKGSKNKSTRSTKSKSQAAKKSANTSKSRTSSKSRAENSRASQRAREIQAQRNSDKRVVDEIWAIIIIAIGVFLAVATLTTGAGIVGAAVDGVLKGLFGWVAYAMPFYLIVFGVLLIARQTSHISVRTFVLLFIMLIMACTINSIRFIGPEGGHLTKDIIKSFYSTGAVLTSGGWFGMLIGTLLINWLGVSGCWIFTVVAIIICLSLVLNTPVSRAFEKLRQRIERRKLIKQNAHLDENVEYGEQLSIDDLKQEPEVRRIPVTVSGDKDNKQPEPLNSAASLDFCQAKRDNRTDKSGKTGKAEEKSSLIKLMNNDGLLNREKSGTRGIEPKTEPQDGFGLDPDRLAGFGVTNAGGSSIASVSFAPGAHGLQTGDEVEVTFTEAQEPEKNDPEPSEKAAEVKEAAPAPAAPQTHKKYKLPSIGLLEKPETGNRMSSSVLQTKAMKLEETLREFNVDATVVQVTQGSTVTRYEVQPANGVKVSKIVNLANDIALNMEAKSIRIEAPIPGKAAVGIEVENDNITMVRLREVIDSDEFRKSKSRITIAVGKDINGKSIVSDIKSMPHLLIGGSTGSGKSVCINGIITSLLYKSTPDEVKMILIDPKMVELGVYNGIPQLLIPVVTDPQKAAAALKWAVAEMTDRYKKFADEGVRDLESYNEYVKANGEPEKVMPQIVIIIDELADLMMAAPQDVETAICRLAQLARACGMHLVVATQSPRADVVTGLIKTNIPSKIAFKVSTQVDSRVILDMNGAEKLVGKGDMLFNPMGMSKPIRVQGAFISDAEVKRVVEYVKSQAEGEAKDMSGDVFKALSEENVQENTDGQDELMDQAIELVVRSQSASVSMLQRRFRIGYNRAANIVDVMEERGIVGPQDGSRGRKVLISMEEYQQMQLSGNGGDK